MEKAIITKEQFKTFVIEIYNEYEKAFTNKFSQDTFSYNIVTNHLDGGNVGCPDWDEFDICLCCFYKDQDNENGLSSWEDVITELKNNVIIYG